MIQQIFKQMKDPLLLKKAIFEGKKKYNIKSYQIQKAKPKIIEQAIQQIQTTQNHSPQKKERLGQQNYRQMTEKWAQRELRTFIWLAVCYSFIRDKKIGQMDQSQFEIFEPIFPDKSKQFLCYKSRLLLRYHKSKWQSSEIQFLHTIITQKQQKEKQWNRISLGLFFGSGKRYFKTPQKCRQLWFNHLNPSVNKDQWKAEQDICLIDLAIQNGLKWSLMSKKLQNQRTQHMIKNRFISLAKIYHIDKKSMDDKCLLKRLKKRISNNAKENYQRESIPLQKDTLSSQNKIFGFDLGRMQIQKSQDVRTEVLFDKNQEALDQSLEYKLAQKNSGSFYQVDIDQYLSFY